MEAIRLIDAGQPFALAVVVRATGSTPQKTGAKALFECAGAIQGTLGGGCLEAEARKRALDAMDCGKAFAFDLKLDDDYGWDDGLVCGGSVRIFVEPRPERHRDVFLAAASARERGERGIFLLHLHADGDVSSRWLGEVEIASYGTYPGAAALCAALQSSSPVYCEERNANGEIIGEVYIEPVEPAPVLLIAGGGHVGQAVARLGTWAGFCVTVIDDRASFTDASLYPEDVRTICGDIPKEVAAFPIHSSTYILIVTRGHRHDGVVLKECIHSPAPYIGMIGSKRKAYMVRKGLIEEGIATPGDFDRVFCPVGLAIGAQSVEEIAVSIVAQLVAERRKHRAAPQPLNVYVPM